MEAYSHISNEINSRSTFISQRSIAGWLSLLAGIASFLLGVNNEYRQSPFSAPTSELKNYWNEVKHSQNFDLEEATRKVFLETCHNKPRKVAFSENWLQWSAGKFYEPLSRTQDTDLLIEGGLAECSERSQILKSIAESAGYDCRFVGLGGHVVLEVAMGYDWHVADPEFGICFPLNAYQLAEPDNEDIIRCQLAGQGINTSQINNYIDILQTTHDNFRLPVGSPISPRLHLLETGTHWLRWLIPIAFLAVAASTLFRGHG